MKPWLAPLLIALAAPPLAAQTVWRCGPDGRVFQATPCASGQPLALPPGPPPAAVAEAQAVVARERQALQTLAAERRTREREAVPGPSGIEPRPAEPEKQPPRRKPLRPSSPRLPAEA
jgi:hypothetical protein